MPRRHLGILPALTDKRLTDQRFPAYAAATTLLVSKENLGRASGMVQFAQATAEILAPALAGLLVQTIQLQGVILADLVTFAVAVISLTLVRFPNQQMIGKAAAPLAYLLAGPLADNLFEPLLATPGCVTESIGQVIGFGPGRGIGLLFIVMGLIKMAVTVAGYTLPRIRFLEDELPDAIGDTPDAPLLRRHGGPASEAGPLSG